jgi:hypothetical protein
MKVASASPSRSSVIARRDFPGADHFFQKRQEIGQNADLAVEEQHQAILKFGLHLVLVGDEVGRLVAPVELHAFDHIQHRLGRFRLLHRDHAVVADLLHRLGHEIADRGIVVRRDRRHLRLFAAGLDRARQVFQRGDGGQRAAIQTPLDVDGACPRNHVAHAVRKDRLRQDSGGAGAVTHHVRRPFRRLPQHPDAKVFGRILQVELTCH